MAHADLFRLSFRSCYPQIQFTDLRRSTLPARMDSLIRMTLHTVTLGYARASLTRSFWFGPAETHFVFNSSVARLRTAISRFCRSIPLSTPQSRLRGTHWCLAPLFTTRTAVVTPTFFCFFLVSFWDTFLFALGSNMENDDQTHPSDTLCQTFAVRIMHSCE